MGDVKASEPKKGMCFKKGTAYSRNIRFCINTEEEEGLLMLLAKEPFRGSPVTDAPDVLEFGPFCNHYVYYVIARNVEEIILIDISKSKVDRFPPEDKRRAHEWGRILKEEIVRKALEIVLHFFRP